MGVGYNYELVSLQVPLCVVTMSIHLGHSHQRKLYKEKIRSLFYSGYRQVSYTRAVQGMEIWRPERLYICKREKNAAKSSIILLWQSNSCTSCQLSQSYLTLRYSQRSSCLYIYKLILYYAICACSWVLSEIRFQHKMNKLAKASRENIMPMINPYYINHKVRLTMNMVLQIY